VTTARQIEPMTKRGPKIRKRPKRDLTGKKFGRWTVLKLAGRRGTNWLWKCQCACGRTGTVPGGALSKKIKPGKSTQCRRCGDLRRRDAWPAKIDALFATHTNAEIEAISKRPINRVRMRRWVLKQRRLRRKRAR
jgi:hypothetical protein